MSTFRPNNTNTELRDAVFIDAVISNQRSRMTTLETSAGGPALPYVYKK